MGDTAAAGGRRVDLDTVVCVGVGRYVDVVGTAVLRRHSDGVDGPVWSVGWDGETVGYVWCHRGTHHHVAGRVVVRTTRFTEWRHADRPGAYDAGWERTRREAVAALVAARLAGTAR